MTNEYVANMVKEIETEIRNFLADYLCPATIDSVMEELWTDGEETLSLHSKIEAFVKRNCAGDKFAFDADELNMGLSDRLMELWDLRVVCWMKESKISFRIKAEKSNALRLRSRDSYLYEKDIQK